MENELADVLVELVGGVSEVRSSRTKLSQREGLVALQPHGHQTGFGSTPLSTTSHPFQHIQEITSEVPLLLR